MSIQGTFIVLPHTVKTVLHGHCCWHFINPFWITKWVKGVKCWQNVVQNVLIIPLFIWVHWYIWTTLAVFTGLDWTIETLIKHCQTIWETYKRNGKMLLASRWFGNWVVIAAISFILQYIPRSVYTTVTLFWFGTTYIVYELSFTHIIQRLLYWHWCGYRTIDQCLIAVLMNKTSSLELVLPQWNLYEASK